MKRFLIVALAAFLSIPAGQAAFSDVRKTHDFSDAISYVEANGIVAGYPDGTYKPDAEINRAEFLKIVVSARFSKENIQACQQSYIKAQKPFIDLSDVPTTEWYAPYVCVAKLQGIVKGYPDGTMKPGQNISFVEAAKIIAVSSGLPAEINSADGIWYKPYVTFLEELKAIPLSITTFDKKITRGEMAEMIYRQKSNNKTKPSTGYDALVIGNIVSGVNDCGTSTNLTIAAKNTAVVPRPQEITDANIHQYIISANTNDEAHMSVYRKVADNGLAGCETAALDETGALLADFISTGKGVLADFPDYMGDVLSAFGYFDSESTKLGEIANMSYKGADAVRVFYSLEGQDLPGYIHIRIVANKGTSYIMLSKNLENGITDETKLLAYAAFKECGGIDKPDRACALKKLSENTALKLFVEAEAKKMVQIFELAE